MSAWTRWLEDATDRTYDEFRQGEWDARRALRLQRDATRGYCVSHYSVLQNLVHPQWGHQLQQSQPQLSLRGLGGLLGAFGGALRPPGSPPPK